MAKKQGRRQLVRRMQAALSRMKRAAKRDKLVDEEGSPAWQTARAKTKRKERSRQRSKIRRRQLQKMNRRK
jgi:hypothetical protein